MSLHRLTVAILFLAGMASSLSATAGFYDDLKKLGNAIKQVEDVLKQPSAASSPVPSRQPAQSSDSANSALGSDAQLCEAAANWLSAAWAELRPAGGRELNYYTAYSDAELRTVRGALDLARSLNDVFFIPAFGKPYDQMSDAELLRINRLLETARGEIKVGGQVRVQASPCFEIISNKSPELADKAKKYSSILKPQYRVRPDYNYNEAVAKMREAPKKVSEYLGALNVFDAQYTPREQFSQLKIEILPWLKLSLADDRVKLIAQLEKIEKYYGNVEQRNEYASMVNGASEAKSDQSFDYSGPARFQVTPNKQTPPDYASRIPLYDSKGGGYSMLGIKGIGKEEYFNGPYKDYEILSCQYGPFNGNAGGFTSLYFWNTKRPTLSAEHIQSAIAARKASDVALRACPPTYGEALAYTYGAKEPPSNNLIASQQQEARRAGQRFAPKFATRTDFENTEFTLDGSTAFDDLDTILIPYRVDKSAVPAVITSEIVRLKASGARLLQCQIGRAHV